MTDAMTAYIAAKSAWDATARTALERRVKAASAALQTFPHTGLMGLTPDNVKASAQWQAARKEYAAAFTALRAFNSKYRP